ncbi:uncharacterized protein J4E88_005696 [Alternaria novae-zelandiae]|uniref:uncharacterized protein n=1 Tax=Alternaria novae-zelandiae TaxID=430562 RepID=UPI0020C2934A|nr:uncharacterized protein J4E88_005696 [Alternaria novae-zelandiae]KAI4681189.1 hypothetical protein J4E88_005696 [Alternaria novae-zelandiae]
MKRPLSTAMNTSDGETDYSTDDTPSSTGSDDGWVDFGCGDLYKDICGGGGGDGDDDDDNNNNNNGNGNGDNDDSDSDHVHTHTTYIKIKSKNGASSRVKPPTVSVKHRSPHSRVKRRDYTSDREFTVCFLMILVILALLFPEGASVSFKVMGFVLAEITSILFEGKILRFVLAVVLFVAASVKRQG